MKFSLQLSFTLAIIFYLCFCYERKKVEMHHIKRVLVLGNSLKPDTSRCSYPCEIVNYNNIGQHLVNVSTFDGVVFGIHQLTRKTSDSIPKDILIRRRIEQIYFMFNREPPGKFNFDFSHLHGIDIRHGMPK